MRLTGGDNKSKDIDFFLTIPAMSLFWNLSCYAEKHLAV